MLKESGNMQRKVYEQPKLESVSLELNDILLASSEVETEGELDTNYTVSLGNVTWSDVFGG